MNAVRGPDSKEKSMERMVSLYQLSLLRMCVLYLHDEELARDAVQETFINAYRNLDQFRADSSEQTWQTGLMEIADRFTLKLDISKIEVSEIRTYTGSDSFVYDGYEIRNRNCLVTPFTAKLELEYITDTRPGNDGKGKGPMLILIPF